MKVFVHKVRNMEVMHIITDVTGNSKGVYAMGTYELRSYLTFPCDAGQGKISCFNLDSCKERYRIEAHRAEIAEISFNAQATRLGTTSVKGTVIRVFDASDGTKLHELRRGLRSALIHCLAFSPNGEFLGCSTENETIHVFRIPTDPQRSKLAEEKGWLSSVGDLATSATGLISTEMERYMQEERSFVTLQNPYHGVKTCLNITNTEKESQFHLQVCAMNGFMNGFLIESKESKWMSELQKAYFLTEVVTKETPSAAVVQKEKQKSRQRSRSKCG